MARTAFVTGITGQDGAYLARLLLSKGYRVVGGVRRTSTASTWRLEELGVARDVELVDFDLLELSNIQRMLDRAAPDEVYNLAAQSFVGVSFELPIYTAQSTGIGPLLILEALRGAGRSVRYYQASTSELFGKVQAVPQSETTPFYPRSPYGVAKLFAHWSTINYREAHGLFAVCGILFNHESPLRGVEFVTRKITRTLARIRHGLDDVLALGNLDAKRDWGFAGDYVEGMWRMLQQPEPDDYVLATGETHTVRSFVGHAAAALGFDIAWEGEGADARGVDRKTGRTVVRVDPRFFRPAEVDLLIGDPAKAEATLGWRRQVDLQGLVEMMARADDARAARAAAGG